MAVASLFGSGFLLAVLICQLGVIRPRVKDSLRFDLKIVHMPSYIQNSRMLPCAYEASFSDAPLRSGMEKALSPLLTIRKDGEGSRPGAGEHFP